MNFSDRFIVAIVKEDICYYFDKTISFTHTVGVVIITNEWMDVWKN